MRIDFSQTSWDEGYRVGGEYADLIIQQLRADRDGLICRVTEALAAGDDTGFMPLFVARRLEGIQ